MLLLLLSALILLLASKDVVCHQVCHPFLSEFSTLRFRTTAHLQYIELAATEECRTVEAMNEPSYGLLVLNTKLPLNGCYFHRYASFVYERFVQEM
ncbi:hypothetical protein RB195_011746 [Necator americanus]|uniref:Secreted protein n=1 Tax=Necator americanus TaxID=51031 RepID=A0ABR1D4R0_NECAM